MTMNSMYNKIEINKDLFSSNEIHNFYDCQCWYKSNDEGDINNDQQINLVMDFNEDCRNKQQQERMKEAETEENILKNANQEEKEGEKQDEGVCN